MNGLRFIRRMFALILGGFGLGAVLFATVEVNAVVHVREGEVLSYRPRSVHKAPYEVRVVAQYVKEGDTVQEGQLLMLLDNEEVDAASRKAEADYAALEEELRTVVEQMDNASEQAVRHRRQLALLQEKHGVDKAQVRESLDAYSRQLELAREQQALAEVKEERSRDLVARGLLSKEEHETDQRGVLEARSAATELRRLRREQEATKLKLGGTYRDELTRVELELLGAEAARLSLLERANKLRREVEKQREEKELRVRLAARREVRADIRGTIRYVYNTKASSDRILSGEILVEVAPVLEEGSALYAKFKLTQDEVKRVLAGQPANLKVDAFHFHRYGVLRGRVRYVSPPNDANEFFAIVDLPPPHPFEVRPGYKVRGEIVTGRMKLYELVLSKLFDRVEG
ncbi:HlyD family efflux transporter periplasmic adaptor subunit [Pyxidicoccus parkwayensis]|uniref:HlyD family efflux transporter periplasmic adaptor subunit n=1 Tax=Pyxidicoccus parkwayensis TaxID=2813578 RepID=A0ABX7NZW0_9BACT|nr:HlyD family efflux transporter periplasmic adaptor subunit [Pyxidicoccus parkwaysis]QSQ24462.1 HlyD family efflux transporter periplasmic adaptor subunit [Pyxidicoccus parkwaysis]